MGMCPDNPENIFRWEGLGAGLGCGHDTIFMAKEGPGSKCHQIFCMLPDQTLTLTQISSDFVSNCCTLL